MKFNFEEVINKRQKYADIIKRERFFSRGYYRE